MMDLYEGAFSTENKEAAMKMLDLLVAEGREVRVCTDCEGVYMLIWVDPRYSEVHLTAVDYFNMYIDNADNKFCWCGEDEEGEE